MSLKKKISEENENENNGLPSPTSPSRKKEETLRNKRFLNLQELNYLIHLTKTNDMAEIFKTAVKLDNEDYQDDEIKEEKPNKRIKSSKILLNFPNYEENLNFIEIHESNIKNNFLNYNEIIIEDYLIKIEY